MIMSDRWIKKISIKHRMIDPFVDHQVKDGNVSYGLSSNGYDIRIGEDYKIFTNVLSAIIDPKNFDKKSFMNFNGKECIIPPNSFVLGVSFERFIIPRDILAICVGKSTYARCGIIVNVTPLEPEWRGYLTIEISNTTPLPAKIYSNEGIAQLLFFKSNEPCEVSYANRKGKYQDQEGILLARVHSDFRK